MMGETFFISFVERYTILGFLLVFVGIPLFLSWLYIAHKLTKDSNKELQKINQGNNKK